MLKNAHSPPRKRPFIALQDVVAISARPYGQRAVLKFAQYTGCLSIAGRFTPGTFTNQITKQFREPRLLIITDPRPDAQVPEPSWLIIIPLVVAELVY